MPRAFAILLPPSEGKAPDGAGPPWYRHSAVVLRHPG
ncbi:hypothetical protein BH24ACT4_BH24ACT4_26340 [soil metagenome]